MGTFVVDPYGRNEPGGAVLWVGEVVAQFPGDRGFAAGTQLLVCRGGVGQGRVGLEQGGEGRVG